MNFSNIKAVMFDVDGTLINQKLEMSDNTKLALRSLKQKGIIVTTNTGRPSIMSRHILDTLGVLDCFDYLFSCNGNEVVDLHTNERNFVKPIDKDILASLDNYFYDDYVTIAYYSDDNKTMFYNHKPTNLELFDEWCRFRLCKPEKGHYGDKDLYLPKALALFEPEHYDDLKQKIDDFTDKRVSFFRSRKDCAEIVPNGVTKGTAVDELSKLTGINKEDIMCFGDEENDVPGMLNGVGVMVGGKDRIADLGIKYACEDVHNDGVYKFLKEQNII